MAPRGAPKQARRAARAFLAAYVLFLYGRCSANEVSPVDPQVRGQLRRARALVTPAEHRVRPLIVRFRLRGAGPPTSVLATATIRDGADAIQLNATLELQNHRWVVVALGG